MFDYFNESSPQLRAKLESYRDLITQIKVPAKTILLREGQISKNAYFVQKGCLRTWLTQDGKEVTFQFFFEEQAVSSFESFWTQQPSLYGIETVEASIIQVINKKDYQTLLTKIPELNQLLLQAICQRMIDYQRLFLSRIMDKPAERYAALLANEPHIVQQVPQHYIASYLGITPVSLSRLRNKIKA